MRIHVANSTHPRQAPNRCGNVLVLVTICLT
jgi:hypothetical protein